MKNPAVEKFRRRLFRELKPFGFKPSASRLQRESPEAIQTVGVRRDSLERLCIELWVEFPRLNELYGASGKLIGDIMTDHGALPNLTVDYGARAIFEKNEEERVTIISLEDQWNDYIQFMVGQRIVPFFERVSSLESAFMLVAEQKPNWPVLTSPRLREFVKARSELNGNDTTTGWFWSGSLKVVDL